MNLEFIPINQIFLIYNQMKRPLIFQSGDNIATNINNTLKDLIVDLEGIRKIIPNYLYRFRPEGQFSS